MKWWDLKNKIIILAFCFEIFTLSHFSTSFKCPLLQGCICSHDYAISLKRILSAQFFRAMRWFFTIVAWSKKLTFSHSIWNIGCRCWHSDPRADMLTKPCLLVGMLTTCWQMSCHHVIKICQPDCPVDMSARRQPTCCRHFGWFFWKKIYQSFIEIMR